MNRSLSIALIASLCLVFTARANDKARALPAVKKIFDKAVVAVKKNRDDFAKANETPLNEARMGLQEVLTKLVDEKKDNDAKAVLDQISTLEADVLKTANAPAPLPPVPPSPLKPDPEVKACLCRQKWRHSSLPLRYNFSENGTFVLEGSPRGGVYEVVGENSNFVLLLWKGETVIEVVRVGDRPEKWTMGGQPFVPAEAKP